MSIVRFVLEDIPDDVQPHWPRGCGAKRGSRKMTPPDLQLAKQLSKRFFQQQPHASRKGPSKRFVLCDLGCCSSLSPSTEADLEVDGWAWDRFRFVFLSSPFLLAHAGLARLHASVVL